MRILREQLKVSLAGNHRSSTDKTPDIHFADIGNVLPAGFGWNKQLTFVALLELTAIPLHLLVKPHLGVWTHDEATEQWLADCLLPDWDDTLDTDESPASTASPWWSRAAQQSDRGILLEFRDGPSHLKSSDAGITEFLIYAAIPHSAQSQRYLPSPPASSSPQITSESDGETRDGSSKMIRIYAVPIDSTALQSQYVNQTSQTSATDLPNNGEAYFLSTVPNTTAAVPNSPAKRQKLLNLFEDVKHQRKWLNRRGGEGISKAMAELNSPALHHETQRSSEQNISTANSQLQPIIQRQPGERTSNRTCSVSSFRDVEPLRPQSREQGYFDMNNSSIRGAENVPPAGGSSHLPADMSSFEEQNRSALIRIVMAGMRIYGLQQRRKSAKLQAGSEPAPDLPWSDFTGDDEYKVVYHQTLKAALFTFRKQLNEKIIDQAAMRDVVDQLLALFCSDPLAIEGNMDSFNSGSAKTQDT